MTETTGIPAEQDESGQAFLRYLPRRIEAFERRILRYRFEGWEPSGMMVLGGDLQRLADASDRYGLVETRRHLLTLAQIIRDYVASMRAPDPQQTTRLFALLSAVIRSLPASGPELPPRSAPGEIPPDTELQPAVAAPAEAGAMPASIAVSIAPAMVPAFESTDPIRPAEPVEPDTTIDATERSDQDVPDVLDASVEPVVASESPDSVELAEPVAPAAPVESVEAGELVVSATTSESTAPVEPSRTTEPLGELAPVASNPSVAPAASTERIEPDEPDEPETQDTVSEGGVRRVYHLSDGNAFARELEKRLESEGYAIEPVESLDELSELLMCLVPQVLLVDASHLSELAAIGEIRRDVQKRSQPPRLIQLAVLAAQDYLETRRIAHRAGVDLLLFPPFDIAGISKRLQVLHASAAEEKVRVLIVEDNRADALYAQTVLSRAGMQAQVENDPLRVLEALKSLHPDLVLMDLHMPFANGVEVTMLIRENPVFARLPIVFLSGESDPDSQLEAINAGGDDFLFKPIRPRHLIDAVRDRMRRLHPVNKPGSAPGASDELTGEDRTT